ncbi:tail length tape measure protein [Pseudomonas phage Knedl]|nr:tail length tape measure protein [Pseudomonas phage Knedl]
MSDQIDIVIRETGGEKAVERVRSLSSAAILAHENITKLNKTLGGIKLGASVVTDLNRMLRTAQSVIKSNDQLAVSNTKLATAASKLDAANAKLAISQSKVAVEQQKLQAAMAGTEAALQKAVAAEARANQELAKLSQAQSRATAESARMTAAQTAAQTALQNLATATARAAVEAQRLATEQQRTAAAAVQVEQAQSRLAASQAQAATAQQRFNTEQQRTATAAAQAQAALSNVAAAQSRAATAATNAQVATQRLATEQQRQRTQAANAAAANDRAALAALRLAEAQRKANQELRNRPQVSGPGTAGALGAVAGATGVSMGAKEVLGMADAYTALGNKLVNLAPSMETVNRLTKEMFELADRTRQPVQDVATSFQRFDLAMRDLGAGQAETLRMTETINKAIVVSGATATESAAGLLQLAQAFGSGRLQGDEFRSIMENLPVVADMIAKRLGVTRSELKKLSSDSKITSQVMREAFSAAAADIDERFKKTIPTLGQSFNVLRNNFLQSVGEFDKATGITRAMSTAMLALGKNMELTTVAVVGLGTAMAVNLGPGLIANLNRLKTAIFGVNAALLANPIGLIAGAVAAAAAALYYFGDQIKVTEDKVVTLKDVAKGTLSVMGDGLVIAADAVRAAWGVAIDWLSAKTDGWGEQFRNLGAYLASVMKNNANTFIGTFVGAYDAATKLWDNWPKYMDGIMKSAANVGISAIETLLNGWQIALRKIAEGMNYFAPQAAKGLTEFLDKTKIELPRIEIGENNKAALDELKKSFTDAMNVDYVGKVFDVIGKRSREIANQRIKDAKALQEAQLRGEGANLTQTAGVDDKAAKKAARELEKLKKALANVRGEVDPTENAIKRLARAQEVLTKATQTMDPATKKMLISQEEAVRIMERLRQKYRDALDPIGAVTRKLDEQIESYKLVGDAQQDAAKMLEIRRDLESKNIQLTNKATEAIKRRIEAEREAARANAARNAVLQDTVYKQRDEIDRIGATGDLKRSGQISGGQAAQSVVNIFGEDAMQGTIEAWNAYEQQYKDFLARIDAARQADVISAQTAEKLKYQAQVEYVGKYLAQADSFFGMMAQMSSSGNKKLAAIGKAAAIAQAVINTYQAATAAYAAMAGIPIVGPALGAAAAGAAIVAGLANVQAIKSQNVAGYEKGGYTGNYGTKQVAGVVHGQEYVFNAQATRRLGVNNLEALASGRASSLVANNGGSPYNGNSGVNIQIINNAGAQVTTREEQDEKGNLNLTVLIDQVSDNLAGQMRNRRGELFDATKDAFNLQPSIGAN